MSYYTKSDLEKIVSVQLENLNAMNDLLRIMRLQNELIENTNKKLTKEISESEVKQYPKTALKKKVIKSI